MEKCHLLKIGMYIELVNTELINKIVDDPQNIPGLDYSEYIKIMDKYV